MIKNLTIFLLLAVSACGQSTSNENIVSKKAKLKPDWKTLEVSEFSIQYPKTWELNQSGQMGTSFFLFSSLENDADDFKENVNLIIQDLSGQNIDLNKYTEISTDQIKTMITNSNMLESKRIKTQDEEYHKVIYTGDQGKYKLKFEQYYLIRNNKAYILTLTCEKEKFVNYTDDGESILNSFVVK
jgi:hypothetical protein